MKKTSGFTLIELLIYLALFGIILGGVCGAVYAMLEFGDSNQSRIILQEEGNFLLSKFDWALADAKDLTVEPSLAGLSVAIYNFSDNPLIFTVDRADLKLKRGDKPDNILNSGMTRVSNLTFQGISPENGGAKGVRINLTLQITTPRGKLLNQNFQSSYYLFK